MACEVFDNDIVGAPAKGWWWTRDNFEFWINTKPVGSDQDAYDQYSHQFFFVPNSFPGEDGIAGTVGQFHRDAGGPGPHRRLRVAAEPFEPRLRVGHVVVVAQVEEQFQPLGRVGVREPAPERDLRVRAVAADERVVAHIPHVRVRVVQPAEQFLVGKYLVAVADRDSVDVHRGVEARDRADHPVQKSGTQSVFGVPAIDAVRARFAAECPTGAIAWRSNDSSNGIPTRSLPAIKGEEKAVLTSAPAVPPAITRDYATKVIVELGSRLWLLTREKATEDTRQRAEDLATDQPLRRFLEIARLRLQRRTPP